MNRELNELASALLSGTTSTAMSVRAGETIEELVKLLRDLAFEKAFHDLDIAVRLRVVAFCGVDCTYLKEAAEEIEHLRARVVQMQDTAAEDGGGP